MHDLPNRLSLRAGGHDDACRRRLNCQQQGGMMSRYDLSWRDRVSFKMASRRARIEAIRNTAIIAGLVLVYGIVGAMDYQDELLAEAERALGAESAYAQTLRDCMTAGLNNEIGGFYFPDSERAFECRILPL